MKYQKSHWPLLRIVRLLLAGFFLFDGLMEFNLFMLIIGAILAWQAIANVGCSTGACAVGQGKR